MNDRFVAEVLPCKLSAFSFQPSAFRILLANAGLSIRRLMGFYSFIGYNLTRRLKPAARGRCTLATRLEHAGRKGEGYPLAAWLQPAVGKDTNTRLFRQSSLACGVVASQVGPGVI